MLVVAGCCCWHQLKARMRLLVGHRAPFQRCYKFYAEKSDPTPIPREFGGGSPSTRVLTADVVAPRSEDPKLIIRVITFVLAEHIRSRHISVTDGRTDDLR